MSRLIISFKNDPILGQRYNSIKSYSLPKESKKRKKTYYYTSK